MLVSYGRRFSVILFTVFALALTASSAGAQILYGSITGNVKDAQGAAVPGATVTVVNKETNFTRDTVTTGDGTFTLNNVSGDVRIRGVAGKSCRHHLRDRFDLAVHRR